MSKKYQWYLKKEEKKVLFSNSLFDAKIKSYVNFIQWLTEKNNSVLF